MILGCTFSIIGSCKRKLFFMNMCGLCHFRPVAVKREFTVQLCAKQTDVESYAQEEGSEEEDGDEEEGKGGKGLKKAAAAMAVGVGSFLDPEHLQVCRPLKYL